MKNDNTHANNRGSSPPFQEPEQDFFRWLNGLKSMGQRDEKSSSLVRTKQSENTRSGPADIKDESRWLDEGGESG